MVTLTILSTNILGVMVFQWSGKYGRVPTCKTCEADADEVVHCSTSGMPSQTAPFLVELVELPDKW